MVLPDTTSETWISIPDYPNYEVSNLGRVRRADTGRIRKPVLVNGYLRAIFYRPRERHNFYIHRLVMAAFVGPCPSTHQVNHINGQRTDNRLTNLEYLTPRENTWDSMKRGTHPQNRGEKNGRSKLKDIQITEIRALLATGMPQDKIAALFGVGRQTICFINRGKTWKHVYPQPA